MPYDLSIMPYQQSWRDCFIYESTRLEDVFGSRRVKAHHIGSMAMAGLNAKPEVDIHIELTSVKGIEVFDARMNELGYNVRGESIDPGRYYYDNYRHTGFGVRAIKVHASESSNPSLRDHLLFRDFLRAHPDLVKEYGDLKQRLSEENGSDIVGYIEGKTAFVRRCLAMATKESRK